MTKPKNKSNKKTENSRKSNAMAQTKQEDLSNFILTAPKIIGLLIIPPVLFFSIALKNSEPHNAFWLAWFIIELVFIGIFFYLFRFFNSKKYLYLALIIITLISLSVAVVFDNKPKPTLQNPTFTEYVGDVSFSLGEGGMTAGYNRASLIEPKVPFIFYGYKPVKLYIEDDTLYSDVKIYGGSGFPPIVVKHNKIFNIPDQWDLNKNDRALEIVDKNKNPMYQIYYKTPSHIVINGIFPHPGGVIWAGKNGAMLNPDSSTTFRLKRIFKYPSWLYPGKCVE